jgi:S1-C subfamily serine protease
VAPGDVIQSIDGQPVDGAAGLDRLLDGRNIGDRLNLGIWRDGKTLTVSLTLAAPKR